MQSQNLGSPALSVLPLTVSRADPRAESSDRQKATGVVNMEPRVTELETHLKYIRRDMEEVRGDVKSIKHRLAYSAGGTAVVLGLLGWIANSRFEQVISLLLAH
ncbi:hypothetical protein [Pseudomonas sp. NFX15]|uniref:hypothetical protein n=1 Tax=Pseudomonas sp. NFX15 TaxID=2816958 RepID=UPI003B8DE999